MFKFEPVLIAAVIRGFIYLTAIIFGLKFTNEETEAVISGVVGFIATIETISAIVVRRNVTPTATVEEMMAIKKFNERNHIP